MTNMNGWARFFLIALRLVIGWHFFIEGAYKIQSHWIGKTATNTPWTGEGFFREGYGPLADFARKTLKIGPVEDIKILFVNDDGRSNKIKDDWDVHYDAFLEKYRPTEGQQSRLKRTYNSMYDGLKDWTQSKKSTVVKTNVPWGTVERPMTVTERLANINASLAETDQIQNSMRPSFGSDVEKTRLRSLKTEVAKAIAELNAEYDSRVDAMHRALESVLTEEQRKLGPVPTRVSNKPIALLDKFTMWTLAILGLCLLFGLFTRVASFGLAMFLLSVTLIAPALPWAPTPPGAMGHYVFINLYTIEMVALLVLTAIPTGKWFGIDALFSALRFRRHDTKTAVRPIPIRMKR